MDGPEGVLIVLGGSSGIHRRLLCLTLLGVTACSGNVSQNDPGVVASVNGRELSITDLEEVEPPGGTKSNTGQNSRAGLDALIDQELLAQQAVAGRLDRDPAVADALRRARRRILAEVFAERMIYPREPPSPAQVEEYYRNNPTLFEKRRAYSLAVFTVEAAKVNEKLLAAVGRANSAHTLQRLLDSHLIPFDAQRLSRTAEELPMSQLAHYASAHVGDVLVSGRGDGRMQFIQILGIEAQPTTLERAKPVIERYLTQLHNEAAMGDHLARARAEARISYGQAAMQTHLYHLTAPAATGSALAEGGLNREAAGAALN